MNSRMGWRRSLGVMALLCLTRVDAADPSPEPILRIDAGMHTAPITSIDVDQAGHYAVTASRDKTVRIWEVSTGTLVRTLRPPIGKGREGNLFAVAITPDGRTVAAAGATCSEWKEGHCIYLFDRESGRLQRRLDEKPAGGRNDEVVRTLAFSRDGRWLSVAANRRIRVWDWRSGVEPSLDPPGRMSTFDVLMSGQSWSEDGLLATGLSGYGLSVYKPEAGRLRELVTKPRAFTSLTDIAFAPNGRELAVGYGNYIAPQIVRAGDLTWLQTTVGHDPDAALSQVAWSADGATLYAAGKMWREGRNLVRRWPQAGRGTPIDVATTMDEITDLRGLSTGGVLVASADPAWGVLDGVGNWQSRGSRTTAEFRGGHKAFLVSADGAALQFGFGYGGTQLQRFAVASRGLNEASTAVLLPARSDGIRTYLNRDNRGSPPLDNSDSAFLMLAGVFGADDGTKVFATDPSGTSFVITAGDVMARVSSETGKRLWAVYTPGHLLSVNIASAGKVVVAAYEDGTIRWHRLTDGQEVLAFFPHVDRKRWVLWTPSGYYDASPGGEDLIGWHVNRGIDAAADFFPASRFRSKFYRPDVIDRVLETWDENLALRASNPTSISPPTVARVLPPVVELVSPLDITTDRPEISLRYRTRTAPDAPVTAVRARINGQSLPNIRDVAATTSGDVRELTVRVPPQDSQIQLFAENRHGTSTPLVARVKWSGATRREESMEKPNLYILAIGISQYQVPGLRLQFAAKDAHDFAVAMKRQEGKLYRNVDVNLLTDAAATRSEIVEALEKLRRQVTQHDLAMLFFSGHGENDDTLNYTFLPVDTNPERLRSTGVPMYEIVKTLRDLAGLRRILFIDSCHSGSMLGKGARDSLNINQVINEMTSPENGVVVFSSSTSRQQSLEDPKWLNGAFTKALVEGLNGAPEAQTDGLVRAKRLDMYITNRVKELTGGRQAPRTQVPGGGAVEDFPLAVVY